MQVCAYLYVGICIYVFTWVLMCIDTSYACLCTCLSLSTYVCAVLLTFLLVTSLYNSGSQPVGLDIFGGQMTLS